MNGERGLDVRGLVVQFARAGTPAIADVSFDVPPGRTLSVVGPSGAGKSTMLRAVCGLVRIARGEIAINGRSVVAEPPQARRAAMVFASDALARTMTVRENLGFVLRSRDGMDRVADVARALDVQSHLEKYPQQLSTGERQRVSIARAVLSDPAVLLLDEPLAPLDPDLRVRVRDEIVHVRERFAGPIVFVTHDHSDAMAVADDLVVLIDGRIEDSGDPQRVYDRPATARAAAFLGARPMNLVPGAVFGWDGGVAGFRPERASLASSGAPLRGRVERVERTGADVYVHVRTPYGVAIVRAPAPDAPGIGSRNRHQCRGRRSLPLRYDDAVTDLLAARGGRHRHGLRRNGAWRTGHHPRFAARPSPVSFFLRATSNRSHKFARLRTSFAGSVIRRRFSRSIRRAAVLRASAKESRSYRR